MTRAGNGRRGVVNAGVLSHVCFDGDLAYQVHVRGNNKGCRLVEFVPRYRVSRFDPVFPDNSVNACAMTL